MACLFFPRVRADARPLQRDQRTFIPDVTLAEMQTALIFREAFEIYSQKSQLIGLGEPLDHLAGAREVCWSMSGHYRHYHL